MLLFRNLIFLSIVIIYVNAEVLVTIPDGTIRGRKEHSLRNISFYAFQEIPFAKPPIGELRFREPQPADPWKGILDATENRKICYQQSTVYMVNLTLQQDEDCLYLNVYTPRYPTPDASLPVLFYIYGGGFVSGAANFDTYGPHYFLEHDVILVAANYRLGPFGFISTGDLLIPGNYGLKDQLLALKWVNQNIKYFGGDPEKVTILGQSAGAASVNFHYMSKKSEGLFRAGIAQSGSILSPWVYQKGSERNIYDFASHIDVDFRRNSTPEEMLAFLRELPASEINEAAISYSSKLSADPYAQRFSFVPTVEPEHEDAFITEFMYEAVEKGHINRAPMMLGICSEEMIYIGFSMDNLKEIADHFDANATLLVNNDMHLTDSNQLQAAGEAIHRIYTDGAFADDLGKAVRYYSDNAFGRAIIHYADMQSKFSDIYFYQFSYYGPILGYRPYIEGADRVAHSDDNRFLWTFENESSMANDTPADILTMVRYTTLFTNFVKYLDPTPEPSPLLNDVLWPKVEPDNFRYLNINETLTVKRNPKGDVYPKWVEVYEQMAMKPLITF